MSVKLLQVELWWMPFQPIGQYWKYTWFLVIFKYVSPFFTIESKCGVFKEKNTYLCLLFSRLLWLFSWQLPLSARHKSKYLIKYNETEKITWPRIPQLSTTRVEIYDQSLFSDSEFVLIARDNLFWFFEFL